MNTKNTIVASILMLTALQQPVSADYNKIRAEFKLRLYNRQPTLMAHDEYANFIEPYIQEAERVLTVPRRCAENNSLPLCKEYFDCLLNYNVASFHHYVKPNTVTTRKLNYHKENLARLMHQIKNDGIVQDLNVQEELQKTEELFARANVAYYKKLGFRFKFLSWLA